MIKIFINALIGLVLVFAGYKGLWGHDPVQPGSVKVVRGFDSEDLPVLNTWSFAVNTNGVREDPKQPNAHVGTMRNLQFASEFASGPFCVSRQGAIQDCCDIISGFIVAGDSIQIDIPPNCDLNIPPVRIPEEECPSDSVLPGYRCGVPNSKLHTISPEQTHVYVFMPGETCNRPRAARVQIEPGSGSSVKQAAITQTRGSFEGPYVGEGKKMDFFFDTGASAPVTITQNEWWYLSIRLAAGQPRDSYVLTVDPLYPGGC